MTIITRVIVQPLGGGQPLNDFYRPEDETTEFDTILAVYTRSFGEPFEIALTQVPGVEKPIMIGWLFSVPDTFDLPGPSEQFEMVLIPMFDDLDAGGERTSIFLRLDEQRRAFQGMFDRGVADSLTTATAAWREPDEQAQLSRLDFQD